MPTLPHNSDQYEALERVLHAVVGTLPQGVDRPGQLTMARAVHDAFAGRRHLMVQAGTGTGKGIAYLVPALLLGKPIVVSTSTKALQSQLLDGDLPPILDAVEAETGKRPRVAVIKGRANYLCQLKLADIASDGGSGFEDDPGDQDLLPGLRAEINLPDAPSSRSVRKTGAAVVALRAWAKTTETGDQADLPATIEFDARAWGSLSVSSRECIGRDRCDMGDTCFAEKARELSEDAHLVITNHHLLALDLQTSGNLLPDRRAIVIDEAHDIIDRVTGACAHEVALGVLERIAGRLPDYAATAKGRSNDFGLAKDVDAFVKVVSLLPVGPLRPMPPELVTAAGALDRSLSAGLKALTAAQGGLAASKQAGAQVVKAATEAAIAALDRIVESSELDVAWLEVPDRGRPVLRVAPLDVAPMLAEHLFDATTTILTSATLRAGGDFDRVAQRVGLQVPRDPTDAANPGSGRWESLDVGSPFHYDTQAVLYVAADLPDPSADREGYNQAARDRLVELVTASGGRCLGLFTSHAAAARAAEEVRSKAHRRVLLQGDSPLPRLIEQFREEPATCLFGSLSLWQGVDVPGPSCQLVVIDKLPFPRPDDPLPAARKAFVDSHGGNGFSSVYASHAAVLLAQGVGRLIRSATDKGVVAILDPRLHTKSYGRSMLNELPPMRRLRELEPVLGALRRIDT